MEFLPSTDPAPEAEGERFRFLFHGDLLLVRPGASGTDAIPLVRPGEGEGALPLLRRLPLGTLDGVPCEAAETSTGEAPPGTEFATLRSLFGAFPERLFLLAGRAFQVVDWDRGNAFCGRCGSPTAPLDGERGRSCTACGRLSFPPVSPAVIVAIVRDGKLLLARGRRTPPLPFHSVLAGFVEPGETLEECVRREVREEAGIEVADVRYFGSQPWPFPHSLMVGFTAAWAGGEIVPDEKEILEAAWYGPEEVRALETPRSVSIAGRLVAWFLRGGAAGEPGEP